MRHLSSQLACRSKDERPRLSWGKPFDPYSEERVRKAKACKATVVSERSKSLKGKKSRRKKVGYTAEILSEVKPSSCFYDVACKDELLEQPDVTNKDELLEQPKFSSDIGEKKNTGKQRKLAPVPEIHDFEEHEMIETGNLIKKSEFLRHGRSLDDMYLPKGNATGAYASQNSNARRAKGGIGIYS
ncbi:OLC1v1026020C1 [Oldenlandia corymbosa var. corymbosa]|uniref:OLC1v1026020C1 n=1 Tax=Oldenlandia corymbosa var. corymbosa TaxID=529605 RepID=A0AAV1C951_OLDCO|nr:OLC1v1026020C1 [Oldenlandia corymbosa var. corymbosa]